MGFLGIGSESGLLGTGVGASKPKTIKPKYLDFERSDFANPAEEYRGTVLNQFRAVNRGAPQIRSSKDVIGAAIDRRSLDATRLNYSDEPFQRGLARTTGAAGEEAGIAGSQQYGLGLLQSAAEGKVPSAAEIQLRTGLDASLRQQAALAASARGGAGAQMLARGQAAQQAALLGAQTNQQQAALRAQEMANARGMFQSAIEQARGQTQAAQQLGLTQAGMGLTKREQDIGVGMGLRGQELQMALAQSGYGQQAALANQAVQQSTNIANQNAALQTQAQQDQYRLGLLNQLTGLDVSTMQGLQAYNQLRNQQNVALQGGLMGQYGPMIGQYGRTQGATAGFLSSMLGPYINPSGTVSDVLGGSGGSAAVSGGSGGGGGSASGGGLGGLMALFA